MQKDIHPDVSYWLSEIATARKREKDFRKNGERILQIYGAEKTETTPFNILFSNTETLLPAIYSASPQPIVMRRFKDENPVGLYAARAGQRILSFALDTNTEGYETFNDALQAAVLDSLLPGRGVTAVKYDAEFLEIPEEVEQEDVGADVAEDAQEQTATIPYKSSELVCCESKPWNRVYFGHARKWSKVPWIAYEEYIDHAEAIRLFGQKIADRIKYDDIDASSEDGRSRKEEQGDSKTAMIYQIWDKRGGRKIRYVSPYYKEGFLKVEDDPLELTGFFNCPRPIQFIAKANDIEPVAMYSLYENQAKELNRLTIRINRIAEAIKARGVYDTELGDDLGNIMKADDNELIPADKAASLAAEKGLGNAIWFMPIEQLVNVLDKLLIAREKCKQVIYEITGISDIIRGSTVASETATAQNIKNQWGTLRLRRLQKEVQRYARDLLRIMLEIAATKFSEETWQKMTGMPFVTSEQKTQAQIMAATAQMTGSQLDSQTLQLLQMPSWGDILAILKDDVQRSFQIDIETNSTLEPEAAEDQKNISDLLAALSQYLNGVGPLVQKGILPFGAAQAMLLAISRRFRFGQEIEEHIKAMQPPPPQDDGRAMEMQKMQAEAQMRLSEANLRAQQEAAAAQNENQMRMLELRAEMQVKAVELQAEKELAMQKMQSEHMAEIAKLNLEYRTEQMKMAMQRDTALKEAEIAAGAQRDVARIGVLGSDKSFEEQAAIEQQAKAHEVAAIGASMDAMTQSLLAGIQDAINRLKEPRVAIMSDGRQVTIQ